jgi:YgiT-type zinc finger domain-containing protein
MRTCSACGAVLKREKITYTQTIGDKFYIVKDVPAEVCPQCGEQYLSPDTVDAIQAVIERAKPSKTIRVPVFHLEPAASAR